MPRPNLAGYAPNFNTLSRAITDGNAAIVEALDTRTNRRAVIVVAVQRSADESIQMVPLAQLLDGNPYEYLASPDPASDGYRAPGGKVITQMQADHAENSPADSPTLDEIARILADEEWNADTGGRIADLLIANGRDLTPTQEYPEQEPPTRYFVIIVDDGQTELSETCNTRQGAETAFIAHANEMQDRITGRTHHQITTYAAAVDYFDTTGTYAQIHETR